MQADTFALILKQAMRILKFTEKLFTVCNSWCSRNATAELMTYFFFRYDARHHANMSVLCKPLKPHFYIVDLGFTGVYIFF